MDERTNERTNDEVNQAKNVGRNEGIGRDVGDADVARAQERKTATTVTGPGETSVSRKDAAVDEDRDVERGNVGGRSAGGNAGTGGVSTNDVGGDFADKQPGIEK